MIHFKESMEILEAVTIAPAGVKKLPLTQTLGEVLAEDIVAGYNSPEFPTAAMDGFAIRAEDQKRAPLRIVGATPAGSEADELGVGEAIKTFTGSLMPKGADTLIPIENVRANEEKLYIEQEVPKGFSVREPGEQFAKGEVLIEKGIKIDFAHIGVMASLNVVSPLVYEKPRVAILSTGSELLELGESQTSPAQIRSANNYTLEAIVQRYGGEPQQLGCIGDDKQSILKAIDLASKQADIVVTTGGVSVGDYDFVKDVVEALGFRQLFKGVRIKPGQHILLAQKGDTFLVGLPGFAYSATVTALLYLVPLLAKFRGAASPLKVVKATLKEPFVKRAKKSEFTACNLHIENGHYVVDFEGKKIGTSAILTNLLGSAALLMTDESEGNRQAGEEVEVLLLD